METPLISAALLHNTKAGLEPTSPFLGRVGSRENKVYVFIPIISNNKFHLISLLLFMSFEYL